MTTDTFQEIVDQLVIDVRALEPELTKLLSFKTYSRIRNFIFAVARMIKDTQDIAETVYNNIFITTSDRETLERRLADKGLVWGEATQSAGTVRIGSRNLPSSTVTIPQLTKVQTNDDTPIVFETTEVATINTSTPVDGMGYYTVEVNIRAVDAGEGGNVSAMAINTFAETVVGINVVYNLSNTTGGQDEESTESVISRLLESTAVFDRGTEGWFMSEAKNFSFVKDAFVEQSPNGSGVVQLTLAGFAPLTPAQITEVQDYFDDESRNDVGAYTVEVQEVVDVTVNFTITIKRLDSSLTTSDIEDEINAFFNNRVTVGKDIVLRQVEAYIISNISDELIYDAEITSPSTDIIIAGDEIAELGTITVNMVDVTDSF